MNGRRLFDDSAIASSSCAPLQLRPALLEAKVMPACGALCLALCCAVPRYSSDTCCRPAKCTHLRDFQQKWSNPRPPVDGTADHTSPSSALDRAGPIAPLYVRHSCARARLRRRGMLAAGAVQVRDFSRRFFRTALPIQMGKGTEPDRLADRSSSLTCTRRRGSLASPAIPAFRLECGITANARALYRPLSQPQGQALCLVGVTRHAAGRPEPWLGSVCKRPLSCCIPNRRSSGWRLPAETPSLG